LGAGRARCADASGARWFAQTLPSALPTDPRSRAPLAWEFCTNCWALGEHWAGDCPAPAGARKPPWFDNRRYAVHDFLCGSFRHDAACPISTG